jgi:hypothetical protein
MSEKIQIGEDVYAVDSLPDESKGLLGLLNLNGQKIKNIQNEMALAQAAGMKLSDQLVESVAKVKPLPMPKVEGSKPPAANRRSRRASNTTKSKKS